ncbi:hypothetical protein BT96DRAFT_1003542 [Gymnopus androsaceus JB14]|uniref:Uncharacterized protein n=1 Tax=Gymnopus androsaceus JB14 TaxID=1447944 RepID=A0A6A4GTI8_9AGAR|nr:hypothetical protein BT96DRAFT_1003542 [Gymnopus androsaceus JB14]
MSARIERMPRNVSDFRSQKEKIQPTPVPRHRNESVPPRSLPAPLTLLRNWLSSIQLDSVNETFPITNFLAAERCDSPNNIPDELGINRRFLGSFQRSCHTGSVIDGLTATEGDIVSASSSVPTEIEVFAISWNVQRVWQE